MGAHFEKENITQVSRLSDYDVVLFTVGASIGQFDEFTHLPLTLVKGQLLELEWPKDLPPLPMPINSNLYLIMGKTNETCIVGATYERDFTNSLADVRMAKDLIFPKLKMMCPPLSEAKIVAVRASLRVSSKGHLPLYGKIERGNKGQVWYLTGMGSKGLLYHAYFAKKLVQEILSE